jgi:hypothetical protein
MDGAVMRAVLRVLQLKQDGTVAAAEYSCHRSGTASLAAATASCPEGPSIARSSASRAAGPGQRREVGEVVRALVRGVRPPADELVGLGARAVRHDLGQRADVLRRRVAVALQEDLQALGRTAAGHEPTTRTTEWPALGTVFFVTKPRQEINVWTGTNYLTASVYRRAGTRFGKRQLSDRGVEMASAVATQAWETERNGFTFDTPEAWVRDDASRYTYPGYERPLAVWDILDAIQPVKPFLTRGSGR